MVTDGTFSECSKAFQADWRERQFKRRRDPIDRALLLVRMPSGMVYVLVGNGRAAKRTLAGE